MNWWETTNMIEVSGDDYTFWYDSGSGWTLDTSVGTSGHITDANHTGGFGGIIGNTNHDGARADHFETGDAE